MIAALPKEDLDNCNALLTAKATVDRPTPRTMLLESELRQARFGGCVGMARLFNRLGS
jgi:hypothetical protein